jgi:rRNA maturation protein Nop10
MQFIHRISISSSPAIRAELAAMGIVIGGSGLATFELDESHESWPKVQRWIAARRPVDVVRTEFSRKEVASAKWLELMPDWHHGYPQPNEDVFGYREATYDLSKYCPQCGTGLRQKAPFQMKAEPKWGRNGILQLNWVFDEYFVTREVWSKVFEPLGISCRQVINARGAELKTVVQLIVEQETDVITEGLPSERCEQCGQVKYVPVTRGRFPALDREPAGHMAKTRQYFGSGASASKRVVISRELATAMEAESIRGASVRPVAEQSTAHTKIAR